MRDNRKYERVFSSRVDINLWVVIAKLILLTDKYLNEIGLGVGSKAFKLHKHFRHLILFMSMARLFGSFAFTENDLIKMSIAEYSKELFLSVVDDIQEIDSECFSRVKRPSMLFHYSCCELIEQKYGIKAIKSVRDKNQQIWPNAIAIRDYQLTEGLLEQIWGQLPEQPWPVGIHKIIAQKMNLDEKIVSDGIAFLIYSNKVYEQAYGYVFDVSGKVIAEGEHYGHSLQEAKNLVAKRKSMNQNRFSF